MKIKVAEEDVEHQVKLDDGAKVKDALSKVNVNRETVIVERNGEVISSEEELAEGDALKLIKIVSMG